MQCQNPLCCKGKKRADLIRGIFVTIEFEYYGVLVPVSKLLIYSVALVSKRTIPTEQPPLVGEVSANFCG
jgi:hypothetical protein